MKVVHEVHTQSKMIKKKKLLLLLSVVVGILFLLVPFHQCFAASFTSLTSGLLCCSDFF